MTNSNDATTGGKHKLDDAEQPREGKAQKVDDKVQTTLDDTVTRQALVRYPPPHHLDADPLPSPTVTRRADPERLAATTRRKSNMTAHPSPKLIPSPTVTRPDNTKLPLSLTAAKGPCLPICSRKVGVELHSQRHLAAT